MGLLGWITGKDAQAEKQRQEAEAARQAQLDAARAALEARQQQAFEKLPKVVQSPPENERGPTERLLGRVGVRETANRPQPQPEPELREPTEMEHTPTWNPQPAPSISGPGMSFGKPPRPSIWKNLMDQKEAEAQNPKPPNENDNDRTGGRGGRR